MDRLQQRPSKYYETDRVFHNNLLEVLEDCIIESNYDQEVKDEVILILYREFYDAINVKDKKVLGRNLKPRIIV